jgi:hypothetical protein
MARFDGLLPALDPYGLESNELRVEAIRASEQAASIGDRTPGLSVIVLNKDRPDLLAQLWNAWESVVRCFDDRAADVELLVGDTGSTDPGACLLLEQPPPNTRVWRDLSYHFSRCNNDLFAESRYDTVLFMNNDIVLGEHYSALLNAYDIVGEDTSLGALGAVLFFPDGSVQHAGIDFFSRPDLYGFCYHPGAGGEIDVQTGAIFDAPATTGAFLMTRSTNFAGAGGFDERYSAECQDVDLCLRLGRIGLRTRVAHLGQVVHLENGTRPLGEEHWDDRSLFIRRWNSYVESR